jgi:hypothetical protein
VPDVLVMPAFKLSNPMLFFVLMKAYDAALKSYTVTIPITHRAQRFPT